LNANYMAARLQEHYDVLFIGKDGNVDYCNAFCLEAKLSEGSFKLKEFVQSKYFELFWPRTELPLN